MAVFRLLVGVLAAYVGFSFGNSIPKWIESRRKPAVPPPQPAPPAEPQPPTRRLRLLRRKSLRKFKIGSARAGKELLSLDKDAVSDQDADTCGVKQPGEFVPNVGRESAFRTENDTTQSTWKLRVSVARHVAEPGVSTPESAKMKHNSQVDVWKSKLKSLKNKSLANQKTWYAKYQDPPENKETERVLGGEIARSSSEEETGKGILQFRKRFAVKVPNGKELNGVLQDHNPYVQESQRLRTRVEETKLRDCTFGKERDEEDTRLDQLRRALLEGRKADVERF